MRSLLHSIAASGVLRQPPLGVNGRNRLLIYPENKRKHYPLANDKVMTKLILAQAGVPIPKTICTFETIHETRDLRTRLGDLDSFVVKPARGRAGEGIVILAKQTSSGWSDRSGRNWTEHALRQHIGNILFGNYANGLFDRALLEETVEAGDLIGLGSTHGLPDVRIITLRTEPVMAMLRLPTIQSGGKANLHQGAVGVGVDLETGKTTHAIWSGRSLTHHPDTKDEIVGRQVAHWREVLKLSRRAASCVPLGYIGLDIVIDRERGPLILEINARPGLEIQNANRRGLRDELRLHGRRGK